MYRNPFSKELVAINKKLKKLTEGPDRFLEVTKNGKVKLMTRHSLYSPWIYIKPGRFRKCNIRKTWHEMFPSWQGQTFVPSMCQECWKIPIYPENINELIQLFGVLKAGNLPCKCGMDIRTYTDKRWGGYVYADSLDQGREYFRIIQSMVEDMIGPKLAERMILKRGCTEFEGEMDSGFWSMPESHKTLEAFLEDIFIDDSEDFWVESDLSIDIKIQEWCKYANQIGDTSYQNVFPGLKLSVVSRTYHYSPAPWEALDNETGVPEDAKTEDN